MQKIHIRQFVDALDFISSVVRLGRGLVEATGKKQNIKIYAARM
jgi:hypothetical protein